MVQLVRSGDLLLLAGDTKRIIIKVDGQYHKVSSAVIDTSKFVGMEYGSSTVLFNEFYHVLKPTLHDIIDNIERRAQIITFKDSIRIVSELSLHNGSRVLECGAGNGALTIVLADAVGVDGHVYAYEANAKQIEILKKNLEMADLLDRVTIRQGDCYEEQFERGNDAAVTDLPEPWKAYPQISEALNEGSVLCSYLPTYRQIESSYRWLNGHNFVEINCFELIERSIHLSDFNVRPEFNMLGFTGFILTARKCKGDSHVGD